MTHEALLVQSLSKVYTIPGEKTKRKAVDSLSLNIEPGTVFGFLGPNGAGKTTTIKMLLGFVAPTSGEAWIFGKHVSDSRARAKVGYLPEHPYFPKFLTAHEVVKAHAGLAGVPRRLVTKRADEELDRVQMLAHKNLSLSKCSKGMVQRVGLASALVGQPELLILDEPSSGLDPLARKDLRQLLLDLKREGKTIFVSSHLLAEMEPVCDRVAILSHGRLVALGGPADIVTASKSIKVTIDDTGEFQLLKSRAEEIGAEAHVDLANRAIIFEISEDRVFSLMGLLERSNARLKSAVPQSETLEDAFLRLVG